MYFAISLVAAAVITFYLVGRITKMLHAGRHGPVWVFVASLVGLGLSSLALVLLGMYVKGLQPIEMFIITLVLVFVIMSLAFKYINQMDWSAAITTNVANIVIGLITVVTAIVVNGESLEDSFRTVAHMTKEKASQVQSVVSGEEVLNESEQEAIADDPEANDSDVADEPGATMADDLAATEGESEDALEPSLSELDLLPPSAVAEIKKKKQHVYVEPKFRVISLGALNSAVGKTIRIHRKNADSVTGVLVKRSARDVVIKQRMKGGSAITPIAVSRISKLEVYR